MIKSTDLIKLRDNFWLNFAVLFGTALLLVGKKPPFDNEYAYLLRLVKTYDANFLLNDATFSAPANEHWVFNHLFGLLTFVFSIEFISWSGRVICWTILLFALIRLGKYWEIPLWTITASIFLWLCSGQAIIGSEWIIGTFEAKCVAYICLLFALDGFCREKLIYPAILLGLSFSFHPAVGMWGILAAGAALLICRRSIPELFKIGIITALFALPGLLPLLTETAQPASFEDWKFIALVRLPTHFNPFSWSKSSIVLLYLQLAFCLLFYRNGAATKERKFLTGFLSVLCLFFTAGIFLRAFEQYQLLQYMPMRLFPVFVLLFFFFTLAKAWEQKMFAPPLKAIALVGFLCLLLLQNPLSTAFDQLAENYKTWTTSPDDAAKTFIWLHENTPNGTTVIAPPWRKDFWYLARRAEILHDGYPPFSALSDWRKRLEILTGESPPEKGRRENEEISAFYDSLTTEQINEIAARYQAQYLVSESEYPFSAVFTSGKYKVYRLY
ncbi:MAG: hypothetical protein M3033_09655 [Acidobacteriota bacterium]|nr:hypothetical protein [Acidobacteriota bacterium]